MGGQCINVGLPIMLQWTNKLENGYDIQDVCDGRGRILVYLKLLKGALGNTQLAGIDSKTLHETRVMKELVAPWEHSGRVVTADSYFAPIYYALVLRHMGLSIVGLVKTVTRRPL